MRLNRLLTTAGAALLVGTFAATAPAQPGPKAKEKMEKAKERREERREKVKEKKAELKEKHAEKKEKREEKKARRDELKKKEEAGELTDEEKEELDQMEERHGKLKEKRAKLEKKWQERKKTRKERRKKARDKVLEKYPNIKKHPAAVAGMRKHARRMAYLHHARELAEARGRDDLVEKIDKLEAKEKARHQAFMSKHEDKIK